MTASLLGLSSDVLVEIARKCSNAQDVSSFVSTCRYTAQLLRRTDLLPVWLCSNLEQGSPKQIEALLTRIPCNDISSAYICSYFSLSELWTCQQFVEQQAALRASQLIIHWLVSWAAVSSRLDVLCWVLCITAPSLSSKAEDGLSTDHDLTAWQQLPGFPGRTISPGHSTLRQQMATELQNACHIALVDAAKAGHVMVCKVLLDHTCVDLESVLIALSLQQQADALRMLLLPRPPSLQNIPKHSLQLFDMLSTVSTPFSLPPAKLRHESSSLHAHSDGNATSMHPAQHPATTQHSIPASTSMFSQPETAGNEQCVPAIHATATLAQLSSEQLIQAGWGLGAPLKAYAATVLPIAARAGALQSVQVLLELGANPSPGIGPAASAGHATVVDMLLTACAAAGIHLVASLDSALVSASLHGHVDVAQLLLRRGADPAFNSYQAFVVACAHGHQEVAELLLAAGCPANAGQGMPLVSAAVLGRLDIVNLLLARGADPNCTAGRPLSGAACNGHEPVVRALLEAGADPHANDEEALSQATHNGHVGTGHLIVQYSSQARLAAHHQDMLDYEIMIKDRDAEWQQWMESTFAGDLSVLQGTSGGATSVAGIQAASDAHGDNHRQEIVLPLPDQAMQATLATAETLHGSLDPDFDETVLNPAVDQVLSHTACQHYEQSSPLATTRDATTTAMLQGSAAHGEASALQCCSNGQGSPSGPFSQPDTPGSSSHMLLLSKSTPTAPPTGHVDQNGTTSCGTPSNNNIPQSSVVWMPSKLPKLAEMLRACPNCPNRSGNPAHPNCPSPVQLWEAARSELAFEAISKFSWYSIFCDGCGALPMEGRRWRCRNCPRYFMDSAPALQGYDLCDKCAALHAQGQPLPLSSLPHSTHKPDTHKLQLDMPPKEWNDLDNHAQMLVWLNCYEALHPEVPPTQLHHLAVMHVNKDPRRTRITTENLISVLAPGTTPSFWQELLPHFATPPSSSCQHPYGDQQHRHHHNHHQLDTPPAVQCLDRGAEELMHMDDADMVVAGTGLVSDMSDDEGNAWPTMPPPGYALAGGDLELQDDVDLPMEDNNVDGQPLAEEVEWMDGDVQIEGQH